MARQPLAFILMIPLLTALLFAAVLATRPLVPGEPALAAELQSVLLWQGTLPRFVTALLCGAALGLSGVLLQRVLRNPIADPSTLGIASGAQLALTAALVFAPGLIAFSRELVALVGGLAAVGLVLGLAWRGGLEPISVVVSGIVISLVAAALSATLILARGDYVLSLFIWGAGSLSQQSWDAVLALAPRLALGSLVALLMLRPLTLLTLDETGARSLGLALHGMRLGLIAVAVWLAATVTAEVGIIGFIGLAAPALARSLGARSTGQLILAAPLLGAAILSVTDSAVQLLGRGWSDLAPTGAATALLGGPLLLWLLPRIPQPGLTSASGLPSARRMSRPWAGILAIAALGLVLAAVALTLGRIPSGWHLATGTLLFDLLLLRAPRIVVAGTAGAMLAAAGVLLQRLTANPLAGPEVLGVSAGGGVGLAVALMLSASLTTPQTALAVACGSLVVILAMLALTARPGYGAGRLLLAGVAMGALGMALIATVLAQGDTRSYTLLLWMSGSTNRVGAAEAWAGVASCLILLPPLFLLSRWLEILPLGEGSSRALGLSPRLSQSVLALAAALLAGIASLLIGPLSLIGLIAPHLARMLGSGRAREQLAAAIALGFVVMVAADWLSRTLFFPYQVPVGLFASLIGGPYLIWLLNRGRARMG